MKSMKKLETWLSRNELALPGTIRTVFMVCGKKECKCQSRKEADKHGPYFFWDRKVNNKLTSTSIPAAKLKTFQKWIENRGKLEEIVSQIKAESEAAARKSIERKKGASSSVNPQ